MISTPLSWIHPLLSLGYMLAVYADDLLVTGTISTSIDLLKAYLDRTFNIKDLRILHYLLSLEISYLPLGIDLTQKKFTIELLNGIQLPSFVPICTPLPLKLKLSPNEGEPLSNPTLIRQLIGKLNLHT